VHQVLFLSLFALIVVMRVLMNGKRDIIRDWRVNPSLRMGEFGSGTFILYT
jgi:hypothetical protein